MIAHGELVCDSDITKFSVVHEFTSLQQPNLRICIPSSPFSLLAVLVLHLWSREQAGVPNEGPQCRLMHFTSSAFRRCGFGIPGLGIPACSRYVNRCIDIHWSFFPVGRCLCVVSAALLSKSELFLRLLTLTLAFNMTLFARVAKTASRTMVRQFHVEQRGIPGAVGKFVYVVTVSLGEGYSCYLLLVV